MNVEDRFTPMWRAMLLALATLAAWPVDAEARLRCPVGTVQGAVTHVRDGDTIEVSGMPYPATGIAAPEGDEPGGNQAAAALNMTNT